MIVAGCSSNAVVVRKCRSVGGSRAIFGVRSARVLAISKGARTLLLIADIAMRSPHRSPRIPPHTMASCIFTMPSSSKQAELRRLMKLQVEKQKQQEVREKSAPPKSILKSKTLKPAPAAAGVSSLLAAYDDSDSDDNGAEKQPREESVRVSWPENDAELKRTRIIIEPTAEPDKNKRARFAIQEPVAVQHVIDLPIKSALQENDTKVHASKVSVMAVNKKMKAVEEKPVDPETWNEFHALLEEADKPPTNDGEQATTDDTTEKQQAEQTEEVESVDTTEIEQVSYEARIAQLRLKAAARRKKKKAPVETSVATYTPELAMADDEEDGKPGASDALTPLEILRQKKREKAKMLKDEENS